MGNLKSIQKLEENENTIKNERDVLHFELAEKEKHIKEISNEKDSFKALYDDILRDRHNNSEQSIEVISHFESKLNESAKQLVILRNEVKENEIYVAQIQAEKKEFQKAL